jgi:hypothetical protein
MTAKTFKPRADTSSVRRATTSATVPDVNFETMPDDPGRAGVGTIDPLT